MSLIFEKLKVEKTFPLDTSLKAIEIISKKEKFKRIFLSPDGSLTKLSLILIIIFVEILSRTM